jgi:hypothetical protein
LTFNKLFLTQYELTEKEYEPYTKLILASYQDAFKETKNKLSESYHKFLEGVPREDYYTEMIKFQRLDKLNTFIAKEYAKAAKEAGENLVIGNQLNVANMFYRSIYNIQWTGKLIFPILTNDLVTVSVTGSQEVWKRIRDKEKWKTILPQYGTLSKLLADNARGDLDEIQQALTSALIQGKSFTNTARDIRDKFNKSANNALRVARTEGIRNLNAGSFIAAQRALDSGIQMRKIWDATLDTRVRQTHANADTRYRANPIPLGQDFRVGSATGPYPGQLTITGENINCRCARVDLPDDIQPKTRRARDPVREIQWRNASSTEKRNRRLADGTPISPRSRQTTITNASFPEWMKLNNLTFDKSGRIILK